MGYIHKLAANKKGIALIATYLVVAVLIVFVITFVNASIGQNSAVNLFKKQMQAFDLAESGLDKAVQQLRDGSASDFPGTLSPVGTYAVTITDLGLYGTMRRYKIVSVGIAGNISKRLTNIVQVDNYARYIWFTDGENYGSSNVWFWDQDHLNGPTHTNGQLNIAGHNPGPIFDGEVRSTNDQINYFNNGNNIVSSNSTNSPYDTPAFNGGLTLGSNSVNMPRQATYLRNASSSGGLRLNDDATVVLNSTGTMDITNNDYYYANCTGSCSHCCTLTARPLPANGALFVDNGTLTVSGTLNGRLTAGASGDVIIVGSTTYFNNPRVNPSSTNMLGLISESDVTIASSASYNLEVDASIMALNTSFMLENWWKGSPKGTLTVYGGIIQDQRGPVGTFDGIGGEKLTGYSKNYTYDSRMLDTPPPFFPTTGDYVTLAWQED
ncbi:MAG: hypothetical protein NTW18_05740 [Candidatus Omnitrophica bacterium]|nr:hypothetical protein [Candidatus Omnitrophota bacterium]